MWVSFQCLAAFSAVAILLGLVSDTAKECSQKCPCQLLRVWANVTFFSLNVYITRLSSYQASRQKKKKKKEKKKKEKKAHQLLRFSIVIINNMEFSYADHTDSSFLAYADDDDRNKYFLKFLPFADHYKNECDVNFEGAGRINATENMTGTDLFLFLI